MLLEDWEDQRRTRRDDDGNGASRRILATVVSILVIIAGIGTIVTLKERSRHSPAPSASKLHKVTRPVTGPPSSYRLTFASSFSGTQLDSKVWATCYPWAPNGCTNYGNTHDPDLEWYQASQVSVGGGMLHLTAQHEPTAGVDQNGAAKQYACRSGMVTSAPGLQFTYGFIQVVVKIPFSKGLWPALWLAAANRQWPPEIDLLEHWGTETAGKIYFHPLGGAAREGGPVKMPNLGSGWHTFSLSWTKTRLTWYYDGIKIFTSTTNVPRQAMYFIANVADDKPGAGSCTGSMLIKSVKVWQPPA